DKLKRALRADIDQGAWSKSKLKSSTTEDTEDTADPQAWFALRVLRVLSGGALSAVGVDARSRRVRCRLSPYASSGAAPRASRSENRRSAATARALTVRRRCRSGCRWRATYR